MKTFLRQLRALFYWTLFGIVIFYPCVKVWFWVMDLYTGRL